MNEVSRDVLGLIAVAFKQNRKRNRRDGSGTQKIGTEHSERKIMIGKKNGLENDPLVGGPSGGVMTSGTEETENESIGETSSSQRFLLFNLVPSWTVSFVTHVALLVIFAIWVMQTPSDPVVSFEASTVSGEQLDSIDVNFDSIEMDVDLSSLEVPELDSAPPIVDMSPTLLDTTEPMSNLTEMMSTMDASPIGPISGGVSGDGETGSRAGETRKALAKAYGATPESEESVALALEWLAKHQLEDGSWNFDHTIGSGARSRKDPGTLTAARAAATGLALMAFLGSGETHKNGQYRDNVQKGLDYLINQRGKRANGGFSFYTGGYADEMYSHGICSIVLCEAYGMTQDSWLREAAQGSLDYIKYAQHGGGGWRYEPKEPGDTSAVGWQIMALKSGWLGGLTVDPDVLKKAERFLDRVSINSGAHYGYTERPSEVHGRNKGRTAIGLLCRMYMGWGREFPPLAEGVAWLAERGPYLGTRERPKSADMYYNYYATQVLKQYGGDEWKKWNEEMRDYLVKAQDTVGAERGSWYFPDGDLGAKSGGRLYCTAMAAMTLEVYYRYAPLYEDKAVDKPFILD